MDDRTGWLNLPSNAVCRVRLMTVFHPYDHVEIVTDRFANKGVHRGAIGYVIER